MYCWFDVAKYNKRMGTGELGERDKEIKELIPTYSVVMVNKSVHQFADELLQSDIKGNMELKYKQYYINILNTRNAIDKIYEASGEQFWPTRPPRGNKPTIPMANLINLYNIFKGIMLVFGQVFSTGDEFITVTDNINKILNDTINKF